jgi:hypothetical protein
MVSQLNKYFTEGTAWRFYMSKRTPVMKDWIFSEQAGTEILILVKDGDNQKIYQAWRRVYIQKRKMEE